MFQSSSKEARGTVDVSNFKEIAKEIFKIQNIFIYILTFFISMIDIKDEALPFGLAIIAACLGTEIPIVMVFGVSAISTLIFQGASNFGVFIFTSIVYFLSSIIIKPKYSIEERNEIIKTGGKLFGACFFVSFVNNIRGGFLIYNFFMGIIISTLTYCFYKIFVNGIVVIRDFGKKKAFTLEELIGCAIIIGIASTAFSGTLVFGIDISHIIVIFLILLLGWKNGMLLGGVAGVSMGLATGIVGSCSPLLIAVYAVSGILSGFLNRFGKLGVIIGFILGNVILSYLYSGNIEKIIWFREIFIASIGLLLVPSNIKIDLEDIIGKVKLITNEGEYRLEGKNEIKEKLNVVTEAISEITKKYSSIEEEITLEQTKSQFIEILIDNFEDKKENIFYDEIFKNKDRIDDDIFIVLQQKNAITENDIKEILKLHNNFVADQAEYVKYDLDSLIEIINKSYKMNNIDNAKKEEKKIQNEKIANELENVKNIISDVAKESEGNLEFKKIEKEIGIVLLKKNIDVIGVRYKKIKNGKIIIDLKLKYSELLRQREKIVNISETISKIIGKKVVFQKDKKSADNEIYIQTYSLEDKFSIQVGISKLTKDDSNFSGDSNLELKLDDGKYLLAISDGMGSGIEARETSSSALKILKKCLMAGFEKEKALELINSSINLENSKDMYTSLDLAVFDLFEGNLYCIKNGSSYTYIKNKKNINKIQSEEIPLGIVNELKLSEKNVNLSDGDIIILASDGIVESKDIMKNDWLEEFLRNASTNNVQKLADLILAEAIDNNYGIANDDMTVMVAKVLKRK